MLSIRFNAVDSIGIAIVRDPNAVGYEIEYSTDPNFATLSNIHVAPHLVGIDITGLAPNTLYHIRGRTVYANGMSVNSAPIQGHTTAAAPNPGTPPNPTGAQPPPPNPTPQPATQQPKFWWIKDLSWKLAGVTAALIMAFCILWVIRFMNGEDEQASKPAATNISFELAKRPFDLGPATNAVPGAAPAPAAKTEPVVIEQHFVTTTNVTFIVQPGSLPSSVKQKFTTQSQPRETQIPRGTEKDIVVQDDITRDVIKEKYTIPAGGSLTGYLTDERKRSFWVTPLPGERNDVVVYTSDGKVVPTGTERSGTYQLTVVPRDPTRSVAVMVHIKDLR